MLETLLINRKAGKAAAVAPDLGWSRPRGLPGSRLGSAAAKNSSTTVPQPMLPASPAPASLQTCRKAERRCEVCDLRQLPGPGQGSLWCRSCRLPGEGFRWAWLLCRLPGLPVCAILIPGVWLLCRPSRVPMCAILSFAIDIHRFCLSFCPSASG